MGSITPPSTSSPLIRVLVARDSLRLQVATSGNGTIVNDQGQALANLQPNTAYFAQVNSTGIAVGSLQFANGIWITPGENGLVLVNGHWYRGRVRLVWDGQLLAVNELDLEQYLWGVVGAEMPAGWHPEALKAQAIAARSYAVAHLEQPASIWYTLGNDERWQCYRGVESETSSTIAAVSATRGNILVKQGRVFLAQYASTDGVSQIAHGGRGISMSQTGAELLAQRGATTGQILSYYYNQPSLGWLTSTQ